MYTTSIMHHQWCAVRIGTYIKFQATERTKSQTITLYLFLPTRSSRHILTCAIACIGKKKRFVDDLSFSLTNWLTGCFFFPNHLLRSAKESLITFIPAAAPPVQLLISSDQSKTLTLGAVGKRCLSKLTRRHIRAYTSNLCRSSLSVF